MTLTNGGLLELSAAEASRLIASRTISSAELVHATLERLERLNPVLNAYYTTTAETARNDARVADKEVASGMLRGPLHGIPVGVKDAISTAGVRTTGGMKLLANWTPREDAAAVVSLRRSGAIILGKTATTECQMGSSDNPHFGPTRNPWDIDRQPGGSSSGSAAAVASGMTLAALGTDNATSLRRPAAYCGIVGLRPTVGCVSTCGVLPLAPTFDTVGPMTRTVEDAALMMSVIAQPPLIGPGADDSHPIRSGFAPVDGLHGVRIGIPRPYFWESLHADVEATVDRAINVLAGRGAAILDVTVPNLEEGLVSRDVITRAEAFAQHQRWLDTSPDTYSVAVRTRLESGRGIGQRELIDAHRKRATFVAAMDELLQTVDALITPTVPHPAPGLTEPAGPLDEMAFVPAALRLTVPFTAYGGPSASVCCGFADGGLPVGMQIAGRRFDEATVLRIANAYEQATEWKAFIPVDPSMPGT